MAPPLAIQVDHRYHRHRRGRALGGRPDSDEVLRLPAQEEEESSPGGEGKGQGGGVEPKALSMHCSLETASLVSYSPRLLVRYFSVFLELLPK